MSSVPPFSRVKIRSTPSPGNSAGKTIPREVDESARSFTVPDWMEPAGLTCAATKSASVPAMSEFTPISQRATNAVAARAKIPICDPEPARCARFPVASIDAETPDADPTATNSPPGASITLMATPAVPEAHVLGASTWQSFADMTLRSAVRAFPGTRRGTLVRSVGTRSPNHATRLRLTALAARGRTRHANIPSVTTYTIPGTPIRGLRRNFPTRFSSCW